MKAAQEDKTNNRWIRILTGILLAISIIVNIYFLFKVDSLKVKGKLQANEQALLTEQVQKYKSDINRYIGLSANIDKVVADASKKLAEKEKVIRNLKWQKKEMEEESLVMMAQLDSIQDIYLEAIDSLLVERESKKILNTRIESLEKEIEGLNTTVGIAGQLLGDNLTLTPIKQSKGGKIQPSAMVKKITGISICLDILENRISKPGMQSIYFVITNPNATVVIDNAMDGTPEFMNPEFNTNALYSAMEELDYKNLKTSVCTTVTPKNPLVKGLYLVEVFSRDRKLGMSTFTLR